MRILGAHEQFGLYVLSLVDGQQEHGVWLQATGEVVEV